MRKSECYHCQQAALTRRDFLRAGALSFLGISLSDFLRFGTTQALAATDGGAPPAKAQACCGWRAESATWILGM